MSISRCNDRSNDFSSVVAARQSLFDTIEREQTSLGLDLNLLVTAGHSRATDSVLLNDVQVIMTARMDSGRSRTLPTPLNLSSSLYSTTSPPTLLYDLPQASTITPTARPPRPSPRSPPPRSRSRGPRSPTTPPLGPTLSHPRPVYAGRDAPGSPPRNTKHTPPPSRPLSASGSLDFEAFAAQCRAWSVSPALPFSAHIHSLSQFLAGIFNKMLQQVLSWTRSSRRSLLASVPSTPVSKPKSGLPTTPHSPFVEPLNSTPISPLPAPDSLSPLQPAPTLTRSSQSANV